MAKTSFSAVGFLFSDRLLVEIKYLHACEIIFTTPNRIAVTNQSSLLGDLEDKKSAQDQFVDVILTIAFLAGERFMALSALT